MVNDSMKMIEQERMLKVASVAYLRQYHSICPNRHKKHTNPQEAG
jgi:hypothetical protein